MTFIQSGKEFIPGLNFRTGQLAEQIYPFVPGFGVFQGHGLVERQVGSIFGVAAIFGVGDVVLKTVAGVVGGAHHFNLHLFENTLGGEFRLGQLGVGLIPNGIGSCRRKQRVVDAKGAAQLEVRPVVKWIAQALGHGGGPGVQFFAVAGIAGAKTLVDTVRTHGPPLIVVTGEPGLGDIGELVVAGDLVRRQVAVVIDDRLGRRVVVIQALGLGLSKRKLSSMKGGMLPCLARFLLRTRAKRQS